MAGSAWPLLVAVMVGLAPALAAAGDHAWSAGTRIKAWPNGWHWPRRFPQSLPHLRADPSRSSDDDIRKPSAADVNGAARVAAAAAARPADVAHAARSVRRSRPRIRARATV